MPGPVLSILIFAFILLTSVSANAARTATMGMAEGNPAAITCPNKTYLAGFAAQYDTVLSGLQPYCAVMATDGTWAGGAQIYLEIRMSDALPGGSRIDMFCPRDSYIFGFRGYSHVYGIHSIMQLTVTCKNVVTGALTTVATRYPDGVSVTEWRGAQCPADAVADGVFGFINAARIIQFGLSCAQTRPASTLAQRLTSGVASTKVFGQSISPSILSPTNGQRFLNQTQVAIKLAPPPGLSVSGYLVNLQRANNSGQWLAHATIPVGAAQAHLPGGYTGWGAGGTDGRSLAFMTSPGSWRLSAQVSSPKQTGWSNWVNFNVMAPQSPTATKPQRILPKW